MAMRSTNMAMGFRPPLLGSAPVATFFIPPFLGFRGSTLVFDNDEIYMNNYCDRNDNVDNDDNLVLGIVIRIKTQFEYQLEINK
jgi:hypothetical protein